MEHKIDKNFKQQLDQRSLNPNPAAWDRLDAMLSIEEKKKPIFFRSWMAIAAGFVGLLIIILIGFQFAEKEVQPIVNNQIEQKNLNATIENKPTKPLIQQENMVVENNSGNQLTQPITSSNRINNKIEKLEKYVPKNEMTPKNMESSETILATNNKEQTKTPSLVQMPENKQKELENVSENPLKLENKVATVEPKNSTSKITKRKITVDPNMLLSSVEEDRKTILQRVLVAANNTGSNFYLKVATRNIDIQ